MGDVGDIGDIDVNLPPIGLPEVDVEDIENEETGCVGPTVDVYFHEARWSGTTLILKMRLSPTGLGPQEKLGNLVGTVTGQAAAYVAQTGELASPQPSNLPTLNFTGPIAVPVGPVPPDRIFQGEFQIRYEASAWPELGSGLTYKMPIYLTTSGGFCDSRVLNTAEAVFEGIDLPVTVGQIEYRWFDGQDLDTTTSVVSPVSSGPVGWDHGNSTSVLSWAGDDTSSAGREIVTVELADIKRSAPGVAEVKVSIAGNWYGERASGRVRVTATMFIDGSSPVVAVAEKNVTLVTKGGTGQSMGTVVFDVLRGGVFFS